MNTPICDFVEGYAEGNALRLHMPGHKGMGTLERFDITEIEGADSLYEASPEKGGIIAQSEANASALFGCPTFYSTEGSSQCIRAMLFLALKKTGRRLILAARNAHRTFVGAAALLGADVEWIYDEGGSYLSCLPSADDIEEAIAAAPQKPAAVYLTSPDYLGNIADIPAISQVCRRHGVLLLCDCAHGAYLRFLEPSLYPTDLGADLCCSSAHKTLPVLTGGAYLHIAQDGDTFFIQNAKNALALFGSTSPSYLILASLDRANGYIDGSYAARLAEFAEGMCILKQRLTDGGYILVGDEPMKLTLMSKSYGYRGNELADILLQRGIVCEFADPDFTVMMLTPDQADSLGMIADILLSVPKRTPIAEKAPSVARPERVMSPAETLFAVDEELDVDQCIGRVFSSGSFGCPPAVSLLVSGERISVDALKAFHYYGIKKCRVTVI